MSFQTPPFLMQNSVHIYLLVQKDVENIINFRILNQLCLFQVGKYVYISTVDRLKSFCQQYQLNSIKQYQKFFPICCKFQMLLEANKNLLFCTCCKWYFTLISFVFPLICVASSIIQIAAIICNFLQTLNAFRSKQKFIILYLLQMVFYVDIVCFSVNLFCLCQIL
eukprot:TRINITY_DN6006_c0_g1_i7.p2 TRINITY_DN6006_c0_g1~~TRINITY_DN6006_c0_g1_i7.p2  ORF type:complete len:166 (+),score=0.92 TRINITY_DN6006_c0_g1_i7:63-560(+)